MSASHHNCVNNFHIIHCNKRKYTHLGSVQIERLKHPEVRLATGFELQRANGIIDVFQAVNDAVRVIVGGVHTPLVAGVGVRHVLDTICHLYGRKNIREQVINSDHHRLAV